jgi:hypothetical protein
VLLLYVLRLAVIKLKTLDFVEATMKKADRAMDAAKNAFIEAGSIAIDMARAVGSPRASVPMSPLAAVAAVAAADADVAPAAEEKGWWADMTPARHHDFVVAMSFAAAYAIGVAAILRG